MMINLSKTERGREIARVVMRVKAYKPFMNERLVCNYIENTVTAPKVTKVIFGKKIIISLLPLSFNIFVDKIFEKNPCSCPIRSSLIIFVQEQNVVTSCFVVGQRFGEETLVPAGKKI